MRRMCVKVKEFVWGRSCQSKVPVSVWVEHCTPCHAFHPETGWWCPPISRMVWECRGPQASTWLSWGWNPGSKTVGHLQQ